MLILIPAFNESETIGTLIKSIQAEADYADILVVNDGSKDETSFVSKAHGAAVVTHVFNMGYGSALQVGYKYAVRHGYDYSRSTPMGSTTFPTYPKSMNGCGRATAAAHRRIS